MLNNAWLVTASPMKLRKAVPSSSYMIFPELDFSDWKTLREGIIKSAENEKMGYYAGKNRRFEIPIHFAAVVYNISRQKMGLVKMPGYEIE